MARGMTVKRVSAMSGMTDAARQLGVGYPHLWQVLSGRMESPAFLLKVRRLRPDLFQAQYVRPDWKSVCDNAERMYEWDSVKRKYVLKREFDGRVNRWKEAN